MQDIYFTVYRLACARVRDIIVYSMCHHQIIIIINLMYDLVY